MLRVMLSIGGLQLLIMLVLLVRTKALALLLGPEQYGIMAVVDKLLAVVAQTMSLSLPFAAVRFLPGLWTENRAAFAKELRAMGATILALALAAAVLGSLSTALLHVRWAAELAPYHVLVAIGFLTVPVLALVPFLQNALAGRLALRQSLAFQLAHAVLATTSGVLGAWLLGVRGIYVLYAVLGAAFVAWGLRAIRTTAGPAPRVTSVRDLVPSGNIWRFSFVMSGIAFLTPYAALFTHYQVLQHIGAAGAGWMQAAFGIALAVRGVLGAGHAVFLTPQVNRLGSPAERMAWAVGFQRTYCLLAVLVVPPLLLAPDVVVGLLYSRAFDAGAAFVFLFVLVEVVGLLAATYQAIVVALDRLAFAVAQNVAAQVVMIGVAAWLIPRMGIAGAGIAALAAQVLLYVLTVAYLRRRFGLRQGARTTLLTAYVAAAILSAGALGRSGASLEPSIVMLRLAFYGALVLALLLFTTTAERQRLQGIARRVLGRFGALTAP